MNKPLAIIIVIVVGMLAYLTVYSQTGTRPQAQNTGYSQGGHGTQPAGPSAGGEPQ